jgi:tetratricopeptide (TPR) repeat protein
MFLIDKIPQNHADIHVEIRKIQTRKIGYVYVLESSDEASVKIGRSRTPEARLRALRAQSGTNGRSWISPIQPDSFALELQCHAKNKANRLHGEWFSIGFDAAVDCVKSILSSPPTQVELDAAYAYDKYSEAINFYNICIALNRENINKLNGMHAAFSTARIICGAVSIGFKLLPDELKSDSSMGDVSEFEMVVAIYINTADKESIATLIHDSCKASGHLDLFLELLDELRSCAMHDAASAGVDFAIRWRSKELSKYNIRIAA